MAGTQTMRFKSKHNLRRKARIAKAVTTLSLLIGLVVGLYLFGSSRVFALKEVACLGNRYLSDAELREMGGIEDGENLFALSSHKKAARLMESPWIKEVGVRKDFPHGLMVKIEEAVPRAILKTRDGLMLVDTGGVVLEELNGRHEFFLPVIVGSRESRGPAFHEALSLAGVIQDMGIMSTASEVEITGYERGVEDLSVSINGLLVLIGEGEYEEKLNMLMELTDEIKTRMSDIDYFVDMRFNDRVVVKPMNTSDKHVSARGGARG
jgi:cell division protein FtsQ